MARERLAFLRRRIAAIEGRPGLESAAFGAGADAGRALPFGLEALDRLFPAGGLDRAALHEIRAGEARGAGAASGFAAAILARLAARDPRPVLWIVEAAAGREAGAPYAPGLAAFGLDPARLLIVQARDAREALFAFAEGLACRGLAAVTAEIGPTRRLDLSASRRLALGTEGGVMGLLVRPGVAAAPGASATRWHAAGVPGACDFAGVGRPAWRLTLERSRAGLTGVFDVEWDHVRRGFAPLSGASPAAPGDRPDPAPRFAVG